VVGERYVYAVSAKITPHLHMAIAEIPEKEWIEGQEGHPYSIARLGRVRPNLCNFLNKWKQKVYKPRIGVKIFIPKRLN
jgi:hypothetical protein